MVIAFIVSMEGDVHCDGNYSMASQQGSGNIPCTHWAKPYIPGCLKKESNSL